jgi:predicted glutamine amidotransferase
MCGILSDSAYWSGRPGKIPPLYPQRLLMGHYRLATSLLGALECQPIRRNGFTLAHNGSIENYDLAVKQFRPKLESNIDSELLLWAVEQADGDLIERLKQALEILEMGSGWALSVSDGRELLLACSNLDLYVLDQPNGFYWCSVQVDENWRPVAGMKKRELAPFSRGASSALR